MKNKPFGARVTFELSRTRGTSAIFAAVFLSTAVACAPDPGGSGGLGGSQGQGGTTGPGGTTGSGGTGGTGGGAAGAGGTTGTGGAPAGSGGTGAGGAAAGSTGTAGAAGALGTAGTGGAAAGAGGTTGDGGVAGSRGSDGGIVGGMDGGATAGRGGGAGGGGSTGGGGAAGGPGGTTGSAGSGGTVMPSAGCGKSQGRPAKVTVANQKIIAFPPSYDGMTPMPLLIALHACGNPNTQWEGITNNNGFGMEYVRLFPNTTDSGQCWSNYANNIARILQQYDDLMANYCIDKNHVYGVGHSSGAQMLVNILSHRTDAERLKFRAVSPVAADPYNVAAPIPVLYIQGMMDNQRSATSATNAVARFRTANMCAETSKPYPEIMGCRSSDGPQVDPGCKIYDNCVVPTIWCSHNDPSYSGTQHGIPCFALTSQYNFFKSLW